MIDLHCHLLFGVDDGPQTLNDSLALGRALVADGVTQVIVTPHVLNPPLSEFEISAGIGNLEKHFAAEGIALTLSPGGECHYDLSLEEMADHSLNGSRYLLLEFPHSTLPRIAGDLIFSLRTAGLIPIIAHPERNATLLRDPELLRPLIKQGALAQLTAASLAGDFGRPVKQCSSYLLKQGLVHFLASDAHGADWRPPRFGAGVKEAARLVGKERAAKLVGEHPLRVVEDREWLDD